MEKSLVEKRLPVARWEIVDVTFSSDHEEKVIPHTLNPLKAHLVKWDIVDSNSPGPLYRGAKAATKKYIVLRSATAGTFQLRLYIPARYEPETPPIEQTSYVSTAITMAQVFALLFPVGTVYENATDCTNPGTLFGMGTWVAQGAGRVPVGLDAAQTEFDTIGETGGAKTHALTIAELATHSHTQNAHNHTQDAHGHTQNSHNHTQDAHAHGINASDSAGGSGDVSATPQYALSTTRPTTSTTATNQATTATNQNTTATNQATTATNQNTGSGTAHNNLQPYIVECRWRRTA